MRGIFGTLIVLFVVALLFIGQGYREEYGSSFDIDNVTSQLEWTFEYNESNSTVQNIVYKYGDAFGYSGIALAKGSIEYGFNHPEYDFEYGFNILKFVLIIIVILALIPALPIIFGILYMLVIGLKNLFKFFRKKKEGKE